VLDSAVGFGWVHWLPHEVLDVVSAPEVVGRNRRGRFAGALRVYCIYHDLGEFAASVASDGGMAGVCRSWWKQ